MNRDGIIIGTGIAGLIASLILLTKEQIHIVFEALAVPFGIYFIWYGLTQADGIHKWIFTIFGAGNILIDGYLLLKNWGVI